MDAFCILLWQLFLMRNLFLFQMMLPTWLPFLSKILSTLNPFCLTYCPWNRWWQMFSMSTPCFVRPSFGKDALNFENPFDRDILHTKCSPALWNKGPPEWARALFSGVKNKLSADTYSKSFSVLLTFSRGSGCISRPCKIIPKCSLSLEIWNTIDRFPKLFFRAIYQGQWPEHYISIFCLGSLHMLPACPIGHTVFWFWYFHDKKRSPFFHRTKWTSLCNESESKNSARPQQFQATRRNSDAFMEAPV